MSRRRHFVWKVYRGGMVGVDVWMGKVFARKGDHKHFSRDALTRDSRVKWFPLLATRVYQP